MKLSDKLREIALERAWPHDANDLVSAADVLDFVCGEMQPITWHMDGTASYRFVARWPLVLARANGAEDALLKCVQMVKEEEMRRINESR